MPDVPHVIFILASGSLLFTVVATGVTWIHMTMRRPSKQMRPAISLLKPLKGSEDELAENLRSFFRLDYEGPIEVVFATTDADDPALPVARAVAAEFPNTPVKFVLSDAAFGLNPKVANLQGAIAAATHDLVLQSDANVSVTREYLSRVVDELISEKASLLSSVVVGRGERSFGAAMENLQLSAFIAPATIAALRIARVTCVIGKTMLFRRSELDESGGLSLFRNHLAEDFLLGEAYEKAGKRVLLSPTVVMNINVDAPVSRFFGRHTRWLQMRAVIHIGAYIADLFANPVAIAFVALVASGLSAYAWIYFGIIAAIKLGVDAVLVRVTRKEPMRFPYMFVGTIKDLLMGGIWLYGIFARDIEWRGTKLRLGKRSELTLRNP
jgi:ceramide glucosyltransferase